MSDDSAKMLHVLAEMRDLLRLIAEPAIAERDKKLREALRGIVGSATGKKAKAILLMDGTRNQIGIRNECGINQESISNATVVKQYVQEHLKTKDAKKIMKECEEPKTRSHLQTHFGYKSKQALDHHLKPLREAVLLRQKVEDNGTIVFEWSNLFSRLPKSVIKSILGDSK